MTGTVHQLRPDQPVLLTKKQLAERLDRSTRWVEYRVAEDMPSDSVDRQGRVLFDLAACEAWLQHKAMETHKAAARRGALAAPRTVEDRLASLEQDMAELRRRIA